MAPDPIVAPVAWGDDAALVAPLVAAHRRPTLRRSVVPLASLDVRADEKGRHPIFPVHADIPLPPLVVAVRSNGAGLHVRDGRHRARALAASGYTHAHVIVLDYSRDPQ